MPAGTRPDKAFWLSAMRHESAALRAAAATEGALAAPVPSCPDWTVADLLRHNGTDLGWLAEHVVRGATGKPDDKPEPALPDDELLSWWDENLARVLTALDSVSPDLPAWNWAPSAKIARFWHRRFAHEQAVHRWDAQVAVGLPEPIDAALAVDGVTEILDTWLPAGWAHRSDIDGVIQLIVADSEDSWIVRVRGQAVSLLDTATLLPEDHRVDAQLTGSASDLVLSLYGRVPFDNLDVSGDAGILAGLRVG